MCAHESEACGAMAVIPGVACIRVRDLEKQVVGELAVPQTPHPTILVEALSAPPNPPGEEPLD